MKGINGLIAARRHNVHTLFLRLVGEHRPESDVTDALDVGCGGVVLVIDDDAALVVNLDTDGLEVQAPGDGAAADGDEKYIGFELVRKTELSTTGGIE